MVQNLKTANKKLISNQQKTDHSSAAFSIKLKIKNFNRKKQNKNFNRTAMFWRNISEAGRVIACPMYNASQAFLRTRKINRDEILKNEIKSGLVFMVKKS